METITQYESKYIEYQFKNKNSKIFHPDLKKYIKLEWIKERNLVRIRPERYVGFIKIGQKSFFIEPKIKSIDFLYILKEINDPSIYFFDFIIQYKGIKSNLDYFSAFISHFLDMIDSLLKRNYRKKYQKITQRKMNIKGKINFKKQLQKATPFFTGVYCDFEVFTFNNIMNQIIKYTLFLCSKMIYNLTPELIKKFKRIYHYFDRVTLKKFNNNVFSTIFYTSITKSYQKIHQICKLILNYLKYSPQGTKTESFFTFIFDFPIIFQKYLEKIFHKYSKFKVKANISSELTKDDSHRKIFLDIGLYKDDKIIHIIDVKYKNKIKREDLWQILVYCGHYDLKKGSLIYVKFPGEENKRFSVPMFNQDIDIYIFMLEPEKLKNNKYLRKFVSKIEAII